jgi:hypothetical protein
MDYIATVPRIGERDVVALGTLLLVPKVLNKKRKEEGFIGKVKNRGKQNNKPYRVGLGTSGSVQHEPTVVLAPSSCRP